MIFLKITVIWLIGSVIDYFVNKFIHKLARTPFGEPIKEQYKGVICTPFDYLLTSIVGSFLHTIVVILFCFAKYGLYYLDKLFIWSVVNFKQFTNPTGSDLPITTLFYRWFIPDVLHHRQVRLINDGREIIKTHIGEFPNLKYVDFIPYGKDPRVEVLITINKKPYKFMNYYKDIPFDLRKLVEVTDDVILLTKLKKVKK